MLLNNNLSMLGKWVVRIFDNLSCIPIISSWNTVGVGLIVRVLDELELEIVVMDEVVVVSSGGPIRMIFCP